MAIQKKQQQKNTTKTDVRNIQLVIINTLSFPFYIVVVVKAVDSVNHEISLTFYYLLMGLQTNTLK